MAKKLDRIPALPDEIAVEKLRWTCPEKLFSFEATADLKSQPRIIGQPRAIQAIKTGLGIKHPGFNIYVSGLTGTGRSTTVRQILEQIKIVCDMPDDKLYVQNFKEADQPRLIRLPAGQGRRFRKDMEHLLHSFKQHLPGIFESDEYKQNIDKITESFRVKNQQVFQKFEKVVGEAGFAVVKIQMGTFTKPDLMPVVDEKPVPFEDLEKMVAEKKFSGKKFEELKTRYLEYKKEMDRLLTSVRELEKKLREEISKMIVKFGLPYIETLINDIRTTYQNDAVSEYLDEIKEYTLEEIGIFLKKEEQETSLKQMLSGGQQQQQDPFRYYNVNLLVDNSRVKCSPVIIETAPNFKNLFGTIEKMVDKAGNWSSDFMNIKAGSMLRADGGVLVINLMDAIMEPFVWPTLKRTLKYGQLEIENPESIYLLGQSALKPQPIKLDLKVVLIGSKMHYLVLFNYDEDFKKIFKISADFTDQMDRNSQHITEYAGFIHQLCEREKVPHFSPSGVAAVVEESIRMADRQTKLSARFSDVADLIREAGYWAGSAKKKVVDRRHVKKAVDEKIYRRKLIEERIQEYIDNGMIMIDHTGKKVGQINGLAVYGFGDHAFGKPSRITATISLGKAGIINIEREADLSGKIHDKGIQILSGFLRTRFAQDKPLALTASICFEQSYGGIDGDSASSTELYLLLSTLANLPIRQDIAVTGSVNQRGEIQPIGGVNEKIEGFYDVCKAKRLTGRQGVIIPHQNVADLQLRPDVVKVVKSGRFHIWAVKTIDEGMEILTGIRAGRRRTDGTWEEGTVNALVDNKLKVLALGIQKFYAIHDVKEVSTGQRPVKGPPSPPPPPKQPIRREEDDEIGKE